MSFNNNGSSDEILLACDVLKVTEASPVKLSDHGESALIDKQGIKPSRSPLYASSGDQFSSSLDFF